jgi:hypothetical protein
MPHAQRTSQRYTFPIPVITRWSSIASAIVESITAGADAKGIATQEVTFRLLDDLT